MTRMWGMEKRGLLALMRGFVFGMLRVGIAMAMETLGAFRAIEFMPFTGTETERDKERE